MSKLKLAFAITVALIYGVIVGYILYYIVEILAVLWLAYHVEKV